MNQNEKSHIALDILKRVEGRHPNLWSVADDLQQTLAVGRHLEGSVFSLAEAALLSHKLQRGEGPHYHSALLGALVAWRPTKGIYRFHPDLYESLIETDLEGEIPSDVLLRMPSWAVFIETPASENMPFQLEGFWAYLSRLGTQNELVLVGQWRQDGEHLDIGIDPDWDILLFKLQLGHHPVSDLTEKMYRQGAHDAGRAYEQRPDGVQALQDHVMSAMLSLLLYLCSEQPDILNWEPEQPQFKYLGKKRRWLASKNVREWDVGLRLGAALKSARERSAATDGATSNGTPARPHVRRAHWHSYWIGKRGEQSISLRWLPPIPVNVADAEKLPAVLHPVMSPNAP
ncbi:AcrVA2 family anti-CRISPR protein [Verminephrobacter aporrectodeae]|uniref:AcrVA2 family anti-CRISPR protein n=1 Tax=Verminephrobacter aporrectodeae TaxID=1110389 RepID=UPI002243BCF2|nr:hypothetical protein [Verminephrobacter aporrectodeae]MCW8175309.1 hypothetical protein [Verminephrobacter aporrectodeae subsp. tuberculatae]MCW8202794.1 hypothetical protein [Verminephrobacter aporrectodeae subsp. tuberculatae]